MRLIYFGYRLCKNINVFTLCLTKQDSSETYLKRRRASSPFSVFQTESNLIASIIIGIARRDIFYHFASFFLRNGVFFKKVPLSPFMLSFFPKICQPKLRLRRLTLTSLGLKSTICNHRTYLSTPNNSVLW